MMPLQAILCVAVAAIGIAGGAARAKEDAPASRLEFVRAQLQDLLNTKLDAELKKPKPEPVSRNLGNGSLAALILGKDPASVEVYLRHLFAMQNMDASSPDYGVVAWQENHPEIQDANAVHFSAQSLGPIWLGYGDKLSPAFKKEAEPHLRAFLVALKNRQMRTPAYTNIFLMRAVDLILIGEAIGDRDATDYGYSELDRWIDYTHKTGVHEFDSPTYTAVDLNSLTLGYRYAKRPGAHETFAKILDFFWTDICANYFAGRGSLSGPHSRDYDFIGGTGGLAYYLRGAGITDDGKPDMVDFERVYPLANALPGGYQPPSDIQALARVPERTIVSRWDTAATADRTNYVTPDFAVGSASGDYGAQDKLLTVELPSPDVARFPVITITPSENDDPYGAKKALDRSGHSKPHHPPVGLAAVQEKGTVLGLYSITVPTGKDAGTDFTVSVLLPATADEITLGSASATASAHSRKPFTLSGKLGDTLGVRAAKGAVALRLFALDGDDAAILQGATLQLVGDGDGFKRNAVRLVVRPASGVAFPGGRCRLGVLLQCARCEDDPAYRQLQERIAQADIHLTSDAKTRTATARIAAPALTLSLTRESAGRERLLSRTVNGTAVSPAPALLVNGVDYGVRLPAVTPSP